MINLQVRSGFRTALAAVLAAWIGFFAHLQDPFWAVVSVFLVAAPHIEISLVKGILRVVGTLVSATVALWVGSICSNSQVGLVLAIFLFTAVGAYGLLTTRFPIAWAFVAATAFMILTTVPVAPGEVFYTAFWRCVELPVGVAAVLVVGYIFVPGSADDRLEKIVDKIALQQAKLLRVAFESYLTAKDQSNEFNKLIDNLRALLTKSDALISDIGAVQRFAGVRYTMRRELVSLNRDVMRKLAGFYLVAKEAQPLPTATLDLTPVVNELAALLEASNALTVSELKSSLELEKLLHKLRVEFDTQRASLKLRQFPQEDLFAFHAIINELDEVLVTYRQMVVLRDKDYVGDFAQDQKPIFPSRLDKKTLIHSVKVGISCVITFWLWLLSGWYWGRVGLIAALMLGADRNVYVTWNRAYLRTVSNCMGALFAILALSFFVQDVVSLLMALGLGAFIAGYIAAGGPKGAYMGPQVGVSMSLALVTGDVMGTDATLALQRLGGVLIGIVVASCVSLLIFPIKAKEELRSGLADNFDRLGALLQDKSDDEVNKRLVAQHKDNVEISNSLHNPFLTQLWKLQVETLLTVRAIGRHCSIEAAAESLGQVFDIKQVATAMIRDLHEIASAVRDQRPVRLNSVSLGVDTARLRENDTIIHMPSHVIGPAISLLVYLRDLRANLEAIADLLATQPSRAAVLTPSTSQ